jgi:hypothetical protein
VTQCTQQPRSGKQERCSAHALPEARQTLVRCIKALLAGCTWRAELQTQAATALYSVSKLLPPVRCEPLSSPADTEHDRLPAARPAASRSLLAHLVPITCSVVTCVSAQRAQRALSSVSSRSA